LLRKIVAAIVLVPLAVLVIAFAVANRHSVMVSFDPFDAGEPAGAVTLPLFALIIVVLIIGVVIGGAASWLRQGKWRASARRFERELARLRDKLAALERGATGPPSGPGQVQSPPRLKLRPPAW
jgi:uncharacterized integral membrane protein